MYDSVPRSTEPWRLTRVLSTQVLGVSERFANTREGQFLLQSFNNLHLPPTPPPPPPKPRPSHPSCQPNTLLHHLEPYSNPFHYLRRPTQCPENNPLNSSLLLTPLPLTPHILHTQKKIPSPIPEALPKLLRRLLRHVLLRPAGLYSVREGGMKDIRAVAPMNIQLRPTRLISVSCSCRTHDQLSNISFLLFLYFKLLCLVSLTSSHRNHYHKYYYYHHTCYYYWCCCCLLFSSFSYPTT